MKIVVQKVKKSILYSEGKKYSEIKNDVDIILVLSIDIIKEIAKKIDGKVVVNVSKL